MPPALRRLALAPLRSLLQLAGRAYVPGSRMADALAIAERYATDGAGVTLGYFHSGHETPGAIAAINQDIATALATRPISGYVSIKPPALAYDPQLIADIVATANRHGQWLHFDSHEHPTADATLACLQTAASLGGRLGLSVPGRWQRSPDDAETAAGLGVRIRVVKGEWADPWAPGLDPRRGFLDVIDRLAGKTPLVAIATHDRPLAEAAVDRLQAAGTACEIELLNGLPRRDMLALAQQRGIPVRYYIPFGVAWRPYALSKALDNPRIVAWVIKDACKGLAARLGKKSA